MSFLFRSALSSPNLVRARISSHISPPVTNSSKFSNNKSELAITRLIKNKNIKLVIFDKDGTLIEFEHYWSHWVKLLGAHLGSAVELHKNKTTTPTESIDSLFYTEFGCDPDTGLAFNSDSLILSTDGSLIREKLSDLLVKYIDINSLGADKIVDQTFDTLFFQMRYWVEPIGDTKGLFNDIKSLDCKIGVYTDDFNYPTKLALAKLGVWEDIDYVLACDSKPSFPKPSSDAIECLAQKAEVNIDEVLMIGDSTSDIISAKQAGAYACGVLSGVASFSELNSYNADLIFKDIMARAPAGEYNLAVPAPSV